MLLVFWQHSQMPAAQKTGDVIMATPDPKIFQLLHDSRIISSGLDLSHLTLVV